jgi:hypothetical protein
LLYKPRIHSLPTWQVLLMNWDHSIP